MNTTKTLLTGLAAVTMALVLAVPALAKGDDQSLPTISVMAMDYGLTAPAQAPAACRI